MAYFPRTLAAAATVAFLVLTAYPTSNGVMPSNLTALFFGVTSARLTPERADTLNHLDADIVRLDVFSWDIIEPQPGHFDFSLPDRMVALAKQHKLDVLGLIQYSPAWASGTPVTSTSQPYVDCSLPTPASASVDTYRAYPPQHVEDFAHFVSAVVHRYPTIHYWEIWNEPNNPIFWRNAPNAAEYTALLKAAYQAAKATDPQARIVLGGLSLNDLNYLGQIYSAGGEPYFDVMAVHPYNPVQAPQQYLPYELEQLHNFMAQHGDTHKAIWITEIGWPTGTSKISSDEQTQAEYVTQTYTIANTLGYVGAVFWHTLSDCAQNFDTSNPEHSYGLYHGDYSPKPAANMFRRAAHANASQ